MTDSAAIVNLRVDTLCIDAMSAKGPQHTPPHRSRTRLQSLLIRLQKGEVSSRNIESYVENPLEAVILRRALLAIDCHKAERSDTFLDNLPFLNCDYEDILGACCENVIGYMPIPVGMAGLLLVDGAYFPIPLATTEGALVASVSRGRKAINLSGGTTTIITQDLMTRAPCLQFPSLQRAAEAKEWLESPQATEVICKAFSQRSNHCEFQKLSVRLVGDYLYARFSARTGEAMGMNLISKCVQQALKNIQEVYLPDLRVVSLSGNLCTDKKASAVNWIEGRGKSVVAQARISCSIVESVLKTTISSLVALNCAKNHVGSALAGSVGGFNAHASNIVAAMFLATGQDVAQAVESSQCLTTMEESNETLVISVHMPSIEVGTIGGGTHLKPQASLLKWFQKQGPVESHSGENSRQLARTVAAAVLAGELSVCSALATDTLVQAHMRLNQKR